MHISVKQNEYLFINISMNRHVLINELFSAMDKTLKLIFYRKLLREKPCTVTMVIYSHRFIPEEIISLLSFI